MYLSLKEATQLGKLWQTLQSACSSPHAALPTLKQIIKKIRPKISKQAYLVSSQEYLKLYCKALFESGKIYAKRENLNKAIKFFNDAISTARKGSDGELPICIQDVHLHLGEAYYKRGRLHEEHGNVLTAVADLHRATKVAARVRVGMPDYVKDAHRRILKLSKHGYATMKASTTKTTEGQLDVTETEIRCLHPSSGDPA
jgi:tetratricopeptide (TPR) repeat protein